MVHKEVPQAWWFGSYNRAKPSPWLSNTLSELDDKTKQMLNLIEQDADSFAQRAEMYYKKRPILVDMLGDLYRTHRSLAEQYDLLKHSSGTRHTVFGLSSRTQQSRPQTHMNGTTTPGSSCSVSIYDSESEVDDPEQEENDDELSDMETETESSQKEQQGQEQLELMRAEIERLKEQNAALQKVAEENEALKAELAKKDEEKREVIRQLAVSFDMMREENCTLRDHIRNRRLPHPGRLISRRWPRISSPRGCSPHTAGLQVLLLPSEQVWCGRIVEKAACSSWSFLVAGVHIGGMCSCLFVSLFRISNYRDSL